MSEMYPDIALSATLTIVPMLLLSRLLLGLVFQYRVMQNPSILDQLRPAQDFKEAGVYYVRIGSTYLVFIASWASSIAPMLASFMMTLASYPIAKGVLAQTRSGSRRSLTPYQLALTLYFIGGGGYGAIWRWVKYLFSQRKPREQQAKALTTAGSVTLLVTLLR